MSRVDELKSLADELPNEAVDELLQLARSRRRLAGPPYRAVRLGGLWQGIEITDEDVREARRETCRSFE